MFPLFFNIYLGAFKDFTILSYLECANVFPEQIGYLGKYLLTNCCLRDNYEVQSNLGCNFATICV